MVKARTVGVGMDYSPTSKSALRWTAENLLDDGDTIILIHVQPQNAEHTRKILFEETGSPLIPLEEFREVNFSKQYGLAYDPEVLDVLDTLSRAKKVKVVAKVYWGDPREKTLRCRRKSKTRFHYSWQSRLGSSQKDVAG
ncbi:Adenine nucleotide alpha hydrolases-like superfamily protein [Raphanus sativus]|nr:Adenine nucleotide alpha hydrolases-like superfamily protein [Raphanus sativus]